MDVEFLKTLYFRELDRRVQLDGAPTPRIAILGIVGGVFTYYAERLQFPEDYSTWLFLSCATGAIMFSTLSIVWIIRSYVGYTWAYLPFAHQLASYWSRTTSICRSSEPAEKVTAGEKRQTEAPPQKPPRT